jgi:hypothetical protein
MDTNDNLAPWIAKLNLRDGMYRAFEQADGRWAVARVWLPKTRRGGNKYEWLAERFATQEEAERFAAERNAEPDTGAELRKLFREQQERWKLEFERRRQASAPKPKVPCFPDDDPDDVKPA